MRLTILVFWACLLTTQSFAKDIVFRCNGDLSEIWIPSHSGEEIIIDTNVPSDSLPKSLSDHPRLRKSKVDRIIRVKPGRIIDTNAFGSPGAPRDKDMYFKYCTEENRALYCKRDKASDERVVWEYFHITIIPPWSVELSEVWFAPKRSNGKIIKRDGFMLSEAYSYSRFSSMNCEQIDPIPALDKIMR